MISVNIVLSYVILNARHINVKLKSVKYHWLDLAEMSASRFYKISFNIIKKVQQYRRQRNPKTNIDDKKNNGRSIQADDNRVYHVETVCPTVRRHKNIKRSCRMILISSSSFF